MQRTADIVENEAVISNGFTVLKEEAVRKYRAGHLAEAETSILALFSLVSTDDERLSLFVNWAMIKRGMKQYEQAFLIYRWASALLATSSHFQQGNFYFGRGVNYEETDEPDKALIEYAGARFHYLEAANYTYLWTTDNNTAFILIKRGMAEEAITFLLNTKVALEERGLCSLAAQVDDTIAQAYLKLNRLDDAFASIQQSIKVLWPMRESEKLALDNSLKTFNQITDAREK